MIQYRISHNLSAEEYIFMRESINAQTITYNQARDGLNHTYHICCCRNENGKIISMARLLWDYGYVAYILDVIVIPQYQRQGLGKTMVNELLGYLTDSLNSGYKVWVTLLSAKGIERFYREFDFEERPNIQGGAGMSKWIIKK